MRTFHRFLSFCLGLVLLGGAGASEKTDAMLAKLKAAYPAVTFTAVNETPVANIYEVVFGRELLYVEQTGTWFFPTMVNMQTKQNLGQDRRDDLARVDFNDLPVKDAVKMVYGKGTRKMAVFADANCGYCKKLEGGLKDLKDVTVYVFPVGILGDRSIKKANAVNCAKASKKAQIWNAMMLEGSEPIPDDCEDGVAQTKRNLELFQKYGFNGTPGIVFENGRVLKGYAENDRLEELLAAKK